ncbi:uncharacterized protein LOC127795543 [Diospyros lotus]|uniref:uncharacterized protein LOC127795543 n=1 Tax=Diospyros lotus TaxID=55363 RepID=UPI0022570DF4|nr:uncharacterized protein LOC127795543 [Diospyros lotus]
MAENRKRPERENAEDDAAKRGRSPAASVDESDGEMAAWLLLDIEDDELSKLLEAEAEGAPPPLAVRFIEDPYSWPLIFGSSYITINGNEESCGSSFSDWESSVMASIDVGGTRIACGGGVEGGSGANASDFDDEMLRRFLGEELFQ